MSSNYALHPSSSEVDLTLATRISLSFFSALVFLTGTLGNFLVWYGSIYHSAIRMEACTRVLITNLALVDIAISLMLYLPLTLTLAAGEWLLGQHLCVVQAVALQVAICLEIFIMMSLNVYRLWAVRRTPGDRARVRVLHVHVYLILVLLLCSSIPLVHLALSDDGIQAEFDTRVGVCRMFLVRDYQQNIVDLAFLVPPLVISFTASKILKCVVCCSDQRTGSDSGKKTQRALSLVCWAMLASYLPGYITLCWEIIAQPNVPDPMYLIRTFFMSLNLVVNPVIYFMYSSSFNCFVRRFFSCSQRVLTNAEQTETVDNGNKTNTNL